MNKFLRSLVLVALVSPSVAFAGGIVTNANQSAAYIRMLARDASTSIDAVYFNPAGVTKLNNGFHISITNQSIFQKKTIENKYPFLNEAKYVGDVAAPLFPSIHAVYKKDKWALGFSFHPNGGGGTAQYDTGLPSFETQISSIPTMLTMQGINTTTYSADIAFDGNSVFWGTQLNASYAINDMISIAAGVRMIYAVNNYNGHIRNIMINPNYPAFGAQFNGGMVPASQFFTAGNATLSALASGANQYYTGLAPIVDGGGGTTLLSNGTSVGLTAEQIGQIQTIIAAAGQNPASMDIATAQQVLGDAAPVFSGKADAMAQNANNTADKKVDAKQTGMGWTPIIGANLTFGEKLNIGLRYEFKTKLEMENDTKTDNTGMFPDGATFNNDIPAILSVGINYRILPELRASLGWHHYFDKNANWEGKEEFISDNLYELALGLEYDINEKLLISAGVLRTQTGVGQGYQTDLSHSLTSTSVGFGGGIRLTEKSMLNLGFLYSQYTSGSKDLSYQLGPSNEINYKEIYNRTNLVFAIGFDYSF